MSLFTIGDLHLSFSCKKPMDVFTGWEDYVSKIEDNWNSTVTETDTTVICGDISWAMNLEQLKADLDFIESLNGTKIILKGNHDYWWETLNKLNNFIEKNNFKTIKFLHNNFFEAENKLICGTRGWVCENKSLSDDDLKIILREDGRLNASLNMAHEYNSSLEKIVFLHYPPIFDNQSSDAIINTMNKYGVKRCYYGHVHGPGIKYAINCEYCGIDYKLVSCDSVKFTPVLVP